MVSSTTNALTQTTQFGRDALGRVTRKTFPDGREVFFTYDGNGNLTSVTPPGRPRHDQSFSLVSLLTEYLPPMVTGAGTRATQYAYNRDKQLTHVTRPDGKVIEYVYDSVTGRLMEIRSPDGCSDLRV